MILITGGAGFIGSVLARKLAEKNEVVIADNLCSGAFENVGTLTLLKGDVSDANFLNKVFSANDFSTVYHFAADPDVKSSAANPAKSFENNVIATFNVLEAMRRHDVERMVFASSSVVYGNAREIPTPETATLQPISNYGASKLACEAYCASYSAAYGIKTTILRYANIFGPPSTHGVLHDFYYKLKKNPKTLEILGDGMQTKSYLFVDDAVNATILAQQKQGKQFDVFNVGSEKAINVKEVAGELCKQMKVTPQYSFTGGKQGWTGDVTNMFISTKKIEALRWKMRYSFSEGVKKYFEWLEKKQ